VKVGDLVKKIKGNKSGTIGVVVTPRATGVYGRGFTVSVATAEGIVDWMNEYVEVISKKSE
jgi:hypothetical protein